MNASIRYRFNPLCEGAILTPLRRPTAASFRLVLTFGVFRAPAVSAACPSVRRRRSASAGGTSTPRSKEMKQAGCHRRRRRRRHLPTEKKKERRRRRIVGQISPESGRKYWATRSSVRSHRSLIRLLWTARFARALHCTYSFARAQTPSLVGKGIIKVSK